jgi:hypothetical protein
MCYDPDLQWYHVTSTPSPLAGTESQVYLSYKSTGMHSPQQALTTLLLLCRKGRPDMDGQLASSCLVPTKENFAFHWIANIA